jgi:hypothetical protein
MVAIDAPDKESSRVCRLHIGDHVCDDAGAALATQALAAGVVGRRVTYRQVGYDFRNKRIVGQMFAAVYDLQCFMLRTRHARYMKAYDRAAGYPILHRCRATVAKAWR